MFGDLRPTDRLAGQVEQLTPTMIDEYEAELRRQESPLLGSEQSRSQCLDHARQLLGFIASRLAGDPSPTQVVEMDLGAERATQGFHASDSLRAAGILFTVVIQTLVGRAEPGALKVDELATVALVVNDVIGQSVSRAAYSYTGFLLNRIREAHVEERHRISRELHDRIGNGVSVAFRNLDMFDMYRTSEPLRAAARVQQAQHLLVETMEGLRQIASDLRSDPLDSVEKEINRFVEMIGDRGVTFDIAVNGDEHWAGTEVRGEAFLIVREALRNILAHARATTVMIRIDFTPDELRAVVHDNGVGFEPAGPRGGGSGLSSMRERAELLNGTVKIAACPGQGTKVSLAIPLSGQASGRIGRRS